MTRKRRPARLRMAPLLALLAAMACACCACGGPRKAESGGEDSPRMEAGPEGAEGVAASSAPTQAGDEAKETAPPDLFSQNQIEWNGKTYRRNTYLKTILCMGIDQKGGLEETTHSAGGRADGVFLLIHDTARGKFQLLMIPRDTMTDVMATDRSGNELGKTLDHLLMAYVYGDGREQSCQYMAEAVTGMLKGLPVDHYAAVDMDVIAEANDAVGGVTVTVPTEGMEGQDPAFVKGATITLHGEQAEKFVHYRDITRNNSALYRMDQHQEYLKGFFESAKAISREKPGIVEELLEITQGHMVTDMSREELLKMGADALGMGGFGDGDIFTVPGYGIAGGLYDEFFVEEKEMIPLILRLFYRETG